MSSLEQLCRLCCRKPISLVTLSCCMHNQLVDSKKGGDLLEFLYKSVNWWSWGACLTEYGIIFCDGVWITEG